MTPLPSLRVRSPLGPILLVGGERGLAACWFGDDEAALDRALARRGARPVPGIDPTVVAARDWITAYFDGEIDRPRPPLDAAGSPFAQEVWSALLAIPPATTRTYGEIARALGRPGAARAVGAANGQNPIGIIVPCHRVIGASGQLTGYAGGLDRKQWLLDHERRSVA
jgi:O-6-methylguanine DNA methyltransferase